MHRISHVLADLVKVLGRCAGSWKMQKHTHNHWIEFQQILAFLFKVLAFCGVWEMQQSFENIASNFATSCRLVYNRGEMFGALENAATL